MRQRFIQSFSTSGNVQTAVDNMELGKPYVAYVEDGQYIDWNTKWIDYASVPLTFEIISGGTIGFTSPIGVTIEYSADNGQTWGAFSSIEVEAGDIIMFRGTGRTATDDTTDDSSNFTSANGAKFNIVGNINSLLDKTNYTGITNLSSYGSHTFLRLFAGLNGLVSAENLVLPATTLASFCYGRMFSSCTNLIKTPKLPANNLASLCYFVMFSDCRSLTTAPSLPATTLAANCYNSMFQNCTSLTTAPALPATTLADSCYYNMFNGCRSLTLAPELPATTLANNCYQNMFYGCTSLTTPPELPATTLAQFCYNSMFNGCTSLTQAPALPAETLANNCYQNMFYGCTGLTTIPSNYLPAATLTQRCYGDMFHNCTSLTTAPELPATTLASNCYRSMFDGCTSLTTAPAILPATIITTATYCYQYMFRGCSSLTTAPELPATTLVDGCYYQMFYGCTNLNYIKCSATNISAYNCTSNWVGRIASSGTFVKNASMTSWPTGESGIPTGWTVVDADI